MTHSLATLMVICLLPILATNCQSSSDRRDVRADFNPMPKIWSGIVDQIQGLERAHAPKQEWEQAASDSVRVATKEQLVDMLGMGLLSPEDKRKAVAAFYQASDVQHFGFDGDFHALVFFSESGHPMLVVRW
jgi:hypothetical protein